MHVYDLSLDQLTARLTAWGEPAFRAKQVYAQLWKRGATYEEMTDVAPSLRERLATELPIEVELLNERAADKGATRKALLKLGDKGHVIEVVLMGYRDRVTVCVSSQAGCAMGCGFCATGQMGLESNLTEGEIAAQVVWARREAARLPDTTPQRLSNVVFMGMGEPMANYRAVRGSIDRITDPAGIRMGARHITVSTVGLVPGIKRLGQDHPQVGSGGQLPRRRRRAPRRPGAAEPPLPAGATGSGHGRLARPDPPSPLDRVGDDRRRERRR